MYLAQVSPLTKIILPEHQERCLDDLKYLMDESIPFEVFVPNTFGAFHFEHNKPRSVLSIIPVAPTTTQDEYFPRHETIIKYLTGGPGGKKSPETAIYGISLISIDEQYLHTQLLSSASLFDKGSDKEDRKAVDDFKKMKDKIYKDFQASLTKARKEADEKVLFHLKTMFNNLTLNLNQLKESGWKGYTPTNSEAIISMIFAEKMKNTVNAHAIEKFNKAMGNTVVFDGM